VGFLKTATTWNTPELTYLKGEVEAASGVQLMVSLHNRVLRELGEAKRLLGEIEAGEKPVCPSVSESLQRGRQILAALIGTVNDTDDASSRMVTVYYTAMEQILAAELEKNSGPIAHILPSIEMLRDRWVEILHAETTDKS